MKNEHVTSISATLLVLVLGLTMFFPAIEENKITGKATTETFVYIVPSDNYSCNSTVPAGWSMIGFPCIIGSLTRGELGDSLDQLDKSFYYVGGDTDPWQSYKRGLPGWVRMDFPSISRSDGIYIYMTSNDTFYYEGQISNETNITMSAGWRLVGYPSQTVRNATEGFESLNGSYNFVRTLNGSPNLSLSSYRYFDPDDVPGSTFNQTIPMGAYWINITSTDVWVVNK